MEYYTIWSTLLILCNLKRWTLKLLYLHIANIIKSNHLTLRFFTSRHSPNITFFFSEKISDRWCSFKNNNLQGIFSFRTSRTRTSFIRLKHDFEKCINTEISSAVTQPETESQKPVDTETAPVVQELCPIRISWWFQAGVSLEGERCAVGKEGWKRSLV